MEASRIPGAGGAGAREADVAPAPDPTGGRTAGTWTPADPGPLGLAAFALTTFLLSLVNANLISGPVTDLPLVLGTALAYGGIAQFAAGLWEFRTGNTFGAVAFCSYGAFWISFYFLVRQGVPDLAKNPSHLDAALGAYLWAWGIFTTYMFVASLRTTGAVALVFLLLAATFIILGIGNSGASLNTIKVGGYVGIATAIAAWYASFAAVINSTFGKTVAPVFPLRRS
jgi:succinate-acetate transporter protein